MQLRYTPKFLIAATLACAALGAQAHPHVSFSIGVQAGPAWIQAGPVYLPAPPVILPPARVYLPPPPVYVPPRVVVETQSWRGYAAHEPWERERAWRRAEWQRHERHERHEGYRGGDRDHDRDHDHDDRGPRRGFRD